MVQGLSSAPSAADLSGSHSSLLSAARPGPPRPVDAVVVPAARPARHLWAAARVAGALGAPLLVLCSREARAAEVVEEVGHPVEAVDLPPDYEHPLLDLATSRATEPAAARLGDLALKRNLGLLLARLAGWRTVLFLDDDVVALGPGPVRRAGRALTGADVVGLAVIDYPDNSVVCHAHRLAGRSQDVFVGGSALLVDTERVRSFFPRVYNEDWLFLLDAVWAGRVTRVGVVRQLPYDPFADARRAQDEEFGELLAEGLMWLSHRMPGDRRGVLDAAGAEHWWRDALRRRRAEIARTAAVIERSDGAVGPAGVLAALAAAERRRAGIPASALAAYVRTWRADRRRWAARIDDLRGAGSPRQALQRIGLLSHTRQSESR